MTERCQIRFRGKIQELYDRATGEAIYPRTCTEAVHDSQGRDLETRLASVEKDTDDKLADYATATQLRDGLATKQDALTVTDDLELTAGGVLSVAERARREVFDDMWTLAGGIVVEPGAHYALNGTTGIIYPEAMKIMDCRQQQVLSATGLKTAFDASIVGVLKAIFPFKLKYQGGTTQFLFYGQKLITKAVWPSSSATSDAQFMFDGCVALKEIQGTIIFESTCNVDYTFRGCVALEDVSVTLRRASISFADSPKLSINSVRNINRGGNFTAAITITVHPDVFAKLTGDTSNAAAAALTEEELAQWAQALDAAMKKNITFATI